ncbi:type II CAAX endopeptidase family protein [Maribellus sp. YY47]|uniref:CPBP family intramembrane glutamic endopeptidase n=1 Tax=Maribellus sp. YY47 TaxID=2929486 RepID=UPI0020013C0F|nr:type II CAAX endopeptidase family protein [Maribellus sp. YY47]MCK3682853.1 CPBP family intramembrane metalloprotease [Maribellus sp. YY47]
MIALTSKNYPNIAQSFGITGIVVLGTLLLSPVNMVLNKLIGKEASMLVYYLLAVGLPLAIVYSIRKSKTQRCSFNLDIENKRTIPFVVVGTIALLFGVISPIASTIPVPDSIKKALLDFGSQTGIFAFILMVIAAPVLEEIIFRGIMLDGLLRQYSPVKSILISSFLFGLVHLNPWQFVTGFIIGIFSGWVYCQTQSLSLSVIIHAAANLSGYITRHFIDMDTSVNETLTEAYGGTTRAVLIISGTVLIAGMCIYFLHREFQKQQPKKDWLHPSEPISSADTFLSAGKEKLGK